MTRLLDMRVRDLLRETACLAAVGIVMWLPVIVALLRAEP